MALNANLINNLRRKIGDTTASPTYTDASLSGYLLDAVGPIAKRMGSSHTANYTATTISPDPDGFYSDLFALQSAIYIVKGKATSDTGKATRIRNEGISIDFSSRAKDRELLAQDFEKERDKLIASAKAQDSTSIDPDYVVEVAEGSGSMYTGEVPGSEEFVDTIV